MTPFFLSLSQRQRLSNLTLSALQDTGWYIPRREYAMHLDLEGLPQGTLGCGLATSACQQVQASVPGTFYCNPNDTSTEGNTRQSSFPPKLVCYTPSSPAACDITPFSNGCGILHPAVLPCSASDVASKLPPGSVNLFNSIPPTAGFSWDSQDFYIGFGAAYGPQSSCLPWTNSSTLRYAGCFISQCDAKGVPDVKAVVNGVLSNIPCPPGGFEGSLLSPDL